jgi:hypothetical protein
MCEALGSMLSTIEAETILFISTDREKALIKLNTHFCFKNLVI